MFYTHTEKTEKKYTVADAVKAAKAILDNEAGQPTEVCVSAVKNRSLDEKITLVELNQLSDSIVTETSLYAMGK